MLSKKDKEWIEDKMNEVVQRELKDWIESFLAYEVTMEEGAEGPGDIGGKITKKKNFFVFDALVHQLPKIAGAMRGSQADAIKAKELSMEARDKVDALGRSMTGMIDEFMAVTKFAIYLKETGLLDQLESAVQMIQHTKQIEDESDSGRRHNTQ